MPIIKLKAHELEVGKPYIAYSAKSKKLTRNGKGGVIVEYIGATKKGAHTFKIPLANGKFFEMAIANLDKRKDAFVLPVNDKTMKELTFTIGDEGKHHPKFGPKTKERAANGIEITYTSTMAPDERMPEEKRDGTFTHIFNAEGVDRPIFLNNFQVKITTDVLALVCTAEELEEKKRQEELAKVAKLKEGGVKLAVGKTEFGLKCLPDIQEIREEFAKKSDNKQGYNCSFATIYGDPNTGELGHVQKGYTEPCHAGVGRKQSKTKDGHERLFILTNVMKERFDEGKYTHKNKAAIRKWVEFMVNDSVYAPLFIDKDVNAIIKYGYVVNCDAPANIIASALMATRCIYEYGHRGVAFSLLREHLPANMAYYVSQFAGGQFDDNGELTSLTFSNTTSGHSPINQYSMTDMGVLHLVTGNFDLDYAMPLFTDPSSSNYYSGGKAVHDIFGARTRYDTKHKRCKLADRLYNMPKQQSAKADPKNPFDVPKSSVEKTVEKAVEYAKEWMAEYEIQ